MCTTGLCHNTFSGAYHLITQVQHSLCHVLMFTLAWQWIHDAYQWFRVCLTEHCLIAPFLFKLDNIANVQHILFMFMLRGHWIRDVYTMFLECLPEHSPTTRRLVLHFNFSWWWKWYVFANDLTISWACLGHQSTSIQWGWQWYFWMSVKSATRIFCKNGKRYVLFYLGHFLQSRCLLTISSASFDEDDSDTFGWV